MLRRATGLGLAGLTVYLANDATTDAVIYARCKDLVVQKAQDHDRLQSSLGASSFSELRLGPWYDSSVTVASGGMLASVTLPCRGPQKGSDITVWLARRGGLRWTLAYNLMGGEWDVIMMDAKVGMGGGGRLSSLSLLEKEAPQLWQGGAAAGGHGAAATVTPSPSNTVAAEAMTK